jgi:hypothetical protein
MERTSSSGPNYKLVVAPDNDWNDERRKSNIRRNRQIDYKGLRDHFMFARSRGSVLMLFSIFSMFSDGKHKNKSVKPLVFQYFSSNCAVN